MFEVILTILVIVSMSFFIIFYLIIRDVNMSVYNVKEQSNLEKEAEEKYIEDFPRNTIFNLKYEIGKIADILIDNQKSNRYTELLREKAQKDDNVKILKNAMIEDIDIVKYNKGNLRAKVKYKDYNFKYSMVLNLSTVSRGRVFLNNYFVYKEKAII